MIRTYNALQKVFGQRRFYTQIGLFPPILAQHPQYKYAIKFDRIPLNIFFSLIHKIWSTCFWIDGVANQGMKGTSKSAQINLTLHIIMPKITDFNRA